MIVTIANGSNSFLIHFVLFAQVNYVHSSNKTHGRKNSIALYLCTYRKKNNLDQDYQVKCLKHSSYVIGKNYMLYILFNNKYRSVSHNCHALV